MALHLAPEKYIAVANVIYHDFPLVLVMLEGGLWLKRDWVLGQPLVQYCGLLYSGFGRSVDVRQVDHSIFLCLELLFYFFVSEADPAVIHIYYYIPYQSDSKLSVPAGCKQAKMANRSASPSKMPAVIYAKLVYGVSTCMM